VGAQALVSALGVLGEASQLQKEDSISTTSTWDVGGWGRKGSKVTAATWSFSTGHSEKSCTGE
jgi:hypothetical protein